MSWYEALLWLSALLGAVGAIVKAVKKALKPFSDAQEKINGIAANVEKLREHDKEQYLSILRLTMMNSEMPISERLIAGERYLNEGGNGDCKDYYLHELIQKHIK